MIKSLLISTLTLFVSSMAWSAFQMTQTFDSQEDFMAAQNNQSGSLFSGFGCAQNMFQQVSDNMTSQYEVQQQTSNALMGIADSYFEHQKTCDANVYRHLDKWREEKARHLLEQNKVAAKIRANEIAFKKAVLEVKRQCQSTGDQQFAQFKTNASTGVLTDVGDLVNRTPTLNKFRKLFYDNCMADPLTVESVQISGMEMRANVRQLEDELKSSADMLTSMTERLKQNQEFEIQQCVKGEEQLKYREAIIQNQNAAAQSLTKKNNLFGLLNAGFTCLQGILPPSDATGARAPTSAKE